MVFVACGLNHKTAPLEVREQVALNIAQQPDFLRELTGMPEVDEAAILSTCNRTEIYCETQDSNIVIDWLAQKQSLSRQHLQSYLYQHHELQGLRHTLRVASGLDSMMLGEPQIFGQLKQAYQQACQVGTIKTSLRQVFNYVFTVSKRIRSQSGIGVNPVSAAYAAVQLIQQYFTDLSGLNVFLIGSGETARLTAKYLFQAGVNHFLVASRSLENASLLAKAFNGQPVTISEIALHLAQADVVISATACPLPFISKSLVSSCLEQRKQAPMFFLDLAVPRDIEVNVADLEAVELYNIDDLQNLITQGKRERELAANQAEILVEGALEEYIRWHRSLKAKDIIIDYRSRMQELATQELQRAQLKLAHGEDNGIVMEEFCHRLMNKLVHTPSKGLRKAAWDGREDLLNLAQYLFTPSEEKSHHEEIT